MTPEFSQDNLSGRARLYLDFLCSVKPNRRTGSPGNREATAFFADVMQSLGLEVDDSPFECLDYVCDRVALTRGTEAFDIRASPYSLGCDLVAELVAASTVEELADADCEAKLLLLRGPIASEQLMPKNFVFYNPEHHRELIRLLEARRPAAIIAATGRKPEQAGALDPFPLIVDGDFDIPNAYCRDSVGEALAALQGTSRRLEIDAQRIPAKANNIVARLNPEAPSKVILTAHIDAYEDSPGASDNASGTVVLLLCAHVLSDAPGSIGVEIVALNGEDHYSAAGQMDYLQRYGARLAETALAINIDDVGYIEGGTSYSFYECPPDLVEAAGTALSEFDGLAPGPPWFNGDHMIFVQRGVPAMAITAERTPELMATITHTSDDTPEIIDTRKLVHLAEALSTWLRLFPGTA
ncbi:MAG TPA: M28 family peptidase [Anaerolineales bacterium]|nr:M28 family peptidase [Anaerolineales bacterium]